MYTAISENLNEYVEYGLHVFPVYGVNEDGTCRCGRSDCGSIGKHPRTANGVDDATNDPSMLHTMFREGDNIGVAMGRSTIWVLDDDGPKENNVITEHLPKTWTAKTGSGGTHYYFRHDDHCNDLKNKRVLGRKLDVRVNNGYIIAPPSNHKSGNKYEWIVGPKDAPLADTPQWLLAAIGEYEKKQSSVSNVSNVGTGIVIDDEMTARARAYVSACEPAIGGQGGHDKTFAVVANLVERFGVDLTDEDLLGVLSEWNDRCSPSWTEKELRHKLNTARRKSGVVHEELEVREADHEDVEELEFPSLHEDAYYGLLGEIVKQIEPQTEADPAGVLLSLLTSVGNAIGVGPHYKVGATSHHANLFTVIVGNTASGKGQALSIAQYLMSQADPDWIDTSIARGLSSGEGLIERINDPESDDPFFVQPLQRLLCIETEFARPITAMRREGNTLSPILRSAWDRDTLEVMTRGKSKLRASNAYISVLAHITPDELSKLLKDSVEMVNGFANRFLWGVVRSLRMLPHGGDVSVLDGYGERLRDAIALAKTIGEMKRTREAEQLWESEYRDLKASKEGVYGRSIDRACPQVVRLSMIYALMDGHPNISVEHLQAALAVWRYCDISALWLFGDEVEQDSLELTILSVLRDGPKTKTEIRQAISSKDRHRYVQKLLAMQDAGRLDVGLSGRWSISRSPSRMSKTSSVHSVQSEPLSKTSKVSSVQASTNNETANPMTNNDDSPSTVSKTSSVQASTMTIAALIDWSNVNGIDFVRTAEGIYWVSPGHEFLVNESIKQAIHEHQGTLSAFVPHEEDFFESMRKACTN